MTDTARPDRSLVAAIRPYLEKEPIGALLLGLSSGAPFAMIASTLTTRLAESGIDKKTVTAFALTFLLYNFKFLWAPFIDRIRIPGLAAAVGQRRAWLFLIAACTIAAIVWMGQVDPVADIRLMVIAALTVAFFGATFDIIIDAFRIDSLKPDQLGAGSGMSQYGWRLGSAGAGALALVMAERSGWNTAYAAAAMFALPAVAAGLLLGEPVRRTAVLAKEKAEPFLKRVQSTFVAPLADFLTRPNAWLVLLFVVIHKIGDTLANLSLRILLADLGFDKDAIAAYDVGFGLVAFMVGIFVGGIVYARMGMMRSVMLSLILMGVSNLMFAWLATMGPVNWALAATMGFENFASGMGGVAVVAYLSWLCDLRFTATQFALLSAMSSILGRFVQGTTAGALIESMGFVNFYLLTTLLAVPGILLFWVLMKREPPAPASAQPGSGAPAGLS
ncbi:AmpG family muropeptide MFS transporter [Sandaracinobacter neustonicus]|uniref:AmpG family muropeptide MFS transporter n=1 Tax=Sandaracinobacter neustonicus TaxID=1715348 RepID=A0A501XDC9_9SPHN|nr:MFS transporter [Sandaracinobacter neustonicus]TPE58486.1 AmpG family muropeptide MFS transporter [Sandaracinobacter neustonicus]